MHQEACASADLTAIVEALDMIASPTQYLMCLTIALQSENAKPAIAASVHADK